MVTKRGVVVVADGMDKPEQLSVQFGAVVVASPSTAADSVRY